MNSSVQSAFSMSLEEERKDDMYLQHDGTEWKWDWHSTALFSSLSKKNFFKKQPGQK